MTVYEYIKSLPKDDMALFLTYYCGNHCISGIVVNGWKSRFMYAIKRIVAEYGEWIIKEQIKTYDFLSKEYEGKEVYQHIQQMSCEEMAGMFGVLSISSRARLEVLMNGEPAHVIDRKIICRSNSKMLKWLNGDI